MTTVTYRNQPGIHKTRGAVPLGGTVHPYTVTKVLWDDDLHEYLKSKLLGRSLHVCCGLSMLGDVRMDLYQPNVHVRGDAARLPFADSSFDTVLIDPPYNGKFQWNHDMLEEIGRVARYRIIFQNHFSPVNRYGKFKKCHQFSAVEFAIAPDIPKLCDLRLAVKCDDGSYKIIEEDGNDLFELKELVAWNPRTYFGRVQLISILDRISDV